MYIIFTTNKSEGIFAPLPIKQLSFGCLFIFIPVFSCEYIIQMYIIKRSGNRIHVSVPGCNRTGNVL